MPNHTLPPITIPEAARELGVKVPTIRAWIGQRRLGHLKLGRAVRIPRAEIERILENSFVPARPERPGQR